MLEIFIYLNGLLGALFIVLGYQHFILGKEIRSSARLKEGELQIILKGVADSHNQLTENQIATDKRLNEIGLSVMALEDRSNQPRALNRNTL